MKKNFVLCVIFFILFTSVGYGGELEIAGNHLKNKEFQRAIKIFSKLAMAGNSKAQIQLGLMYKLGRGVTRDYVIASKWFNIAVANGYKEGLGYKRIMESRMTKEQVLKSRELANEWLKTKAKPK